MVLVARLLLWCVCAGVIAWGSGCAESAGTPRRLPSGWVVEVLSSGLVLETPRTWAIRYKTQVAESDREALDAEATELWAEVQGEVEAAGATSASLWPANLDRHTLHLEGWHPILYTHHSLDFQFERNANGSWRHVPHVGRVEHPLVW
jgi:hypothetical protein